MAAISKNCRPYSIACWAFREASPQCDIGCAGNVRLGVKMMIY